MNIEDKILPVIPTWCDLYELEDKFIKRGERIAELESKLADANEIIVCLETDMPMSDRLLNQRGTITKLQAQLVLANKESSANVENALNHYSRAKQAEAQLEGLRATRTHLQKDVKALQAQLEKVRGLPEKWRREWYDPIRPDKCEFADELQAILEKE